MITEIIKDSLKENLKELGINALTDQISLERPANREHGDWSSNIALVTAKNAGRQARELAEETGITAVHFNQEFVERTAYTYRHKGKTREKEVFWFLAETDSLDVALSHEHRDHLWLDWEQALAQLTHEETRSVVRSAWEKVKSLG